MPKKARDVIAALTQKGFQAKENDHTFLHLFIDGRKTAVYTKVSHGEKEIGDRLLGLMARQIRLSRREFLDLIECPLSQDAYIVLLRNKGVVS
jgi:predicted RNA binding protein YcfA (HicA-like mRNA interferase family)